ncbi:MAG TPA: hypothetical protein VE076_09585 [Nitrososphaeraceae archaeon]|nr:hypothetical protein [Nitrososphaeraceae archaeon]
MNPSQRQQQQESSAVSASSSNSSPSSAGDDDISTGELRSQERLQMIDTMKVPIIQIGKSAGYEVIENYDLGSGPIHVTWIFKPGDNESSRYEIRLCMYYRILSSFVK